MALSIKTQEADRLARELSRLTGESMTQAVTVALRERLEREGAARDGGVAERLLRIGAQWRAEHPHATAPTKAEWDALTEPGP